MILGRIGFHSTLAGFKAPPPSLRKLNLLIERNPLELLKKNSPGILSVTMQHNYSQYLIHHDHQNYLLKNSQVNTFSYGILQQKHFRFSSTSHLTQGESDESTEYETDEYNRDDVEYGTDNVEYETDDVEYRTDDVEYETDDVEHGSDEENKNEANHKIEKEFSYLFGSHKGNETLTIENYETKMKSLNACIDFAEKNDLEESSMYCARAVSYMDIGLFDKAIEDFTRAINLSSDDETIRQKTYMLLSLRASCLIENKMHDEALKDMDQALSEIVSNNMPIEEYLKVLHGRVSLLAKMDRHHEALKDLEEFSAQIKDLVDNGDGLDSFEGGTILSEIEEQIREIKEKQ